MRKQLFSTNIIRIALIVSIVLVALFAVYANTWNSDFVADYLLFEELFKSNIYVSAHTHFIKYPHYFLLYKLFGLKAITLHLSVAVDLFILIFGVIYLYKTVQKKWKIDTKYMLISMFYVVNLSYMLWHFLADPFNRNFDLGIFMILLGILYNDDFLIKSFQKFVLYCLAFSFLLISDSFVLIYLFAPLFGLIFLSNVMKRWKLILPCFIAIFANYYFIKTLHNLSFLSQASADIRIIKPSQFIGNINIFFTGTLELFGVLPYDNYFNCLNLFCLILICILFIKLFVIKKEDLLVRFIFIHFITVVVAYIGSNKLVDISTTRYLMTFPFLIILSFMYFMNRANGKVKIGLISLIILTSIINSYLIINKFGKIWNIDEKYYKNYQLISLLKANNLFYGYSDYWNSGINTFISKNSVKIRQVICSSSNTVKPYQWISAADWYKNDKNIFFIMIDSKDKLYLNGCSRNLIIKSKNKIVFENYTILFFNSDDYYQVFD